MKTLFENWRSHLHETSNEEFLDELEPLLKQWSALQASYGAEGENIPPDKLPKYVQKSNGKAGASRGRSSSIFGRFFVPRCSPKPTKNQ